MDTEFMIIQADLQQRVPTAAMACVLVEKLGLRAHRIVGILTTVATESVQAVRLRPHARKTAATHLTVATAPVLVGKLNITVHRTVEMHPFVATVYVQAGRVDTPAQKTAGAHLTAATDSVATEKPNNPAQRIAV